LSNDPGLAAALDRILDLAIDVTGADFGNIQLVAEDGSLRIVAQRAFDPPFLEFFRVVKHDKSACSAVLHRGRRVVVRDVRRSAHFIPSARRVMIEAGVLACQSTPIFSPQRPVTGVLSTHFRVPHTCAPRELALIDFLVGQAGLIIRGSEVQRQRLEMARAFSELREHFPRRTRIVSPRRAKQ